MRALAPCPKCGDLSRLAAVGGACLECTMIGPSEPRLSWRDRIVLRFPRLFPRTVKRWLTFALIVLALPILLGAKGCSESERCRVLRESAEAVCKASPDSASCATLRQQLETCDVPPVDPTPPPVNCLTHPSCPAGQHCEQGVGCVPDPLPDPEPPQCKPGEVPVIVDGEVVRCDPPPPVPAACSIDGEPGPALPDHVAELGAPWGVAAFSR